MAILIEGIQSIALACSLVLLIPAVGIALLGRRRWLLVATWIAISGVVAWLQFVAWWPFDSGGAWHVLAGVALAGLGVVAWRQDRIDLDVALTAVAATVTTWTWVPCVGEHLGEILNSARQAPWSQFFPSMLYMLGIFMPLVVIAAVDGVWPSFAQWSERRPLRLGGRAIVLVVAALVAANLLDDLAGELVRRSSW